MTERKYYEAYDERYRTAHARGIRWMGDARSPVVSEVIGRYGLENVPMLELGCGEGRDAIPLLERGSDLTATDISPEAIDYCKKLCPAHRERFRMLDCVKERLDSRFGFVFAVAVVHMLLLDEDRDGFYRSVRDHLSDDGIGLVCSMGDGELEWMSDISTAFTLQEREAGGDTIWVAGTSCRMVDFARFEAEILRNGLSVVEMGLTAIEPEFSQVMFAVVRKA